MRRRFFKNAAAANYSTAIVGDILCSDLSIVARADYASSGKTAIAVVVDNNSGKLKCIGLSSVTGKNWDGYGGDITTISNITSASSAQADMDGYNNSLAIWNFSSLNQNSNNAVGWCRLYSTAGTQAGQWYLPAAGEWYQIDLTKFVAINQSLTACSGESISYYYDYFLSSTEKTSSYFWMVFTYSNFTLTDLPKSDGNQYKTRPFLLISY